jgi:glycine dehydrogenase subunit 2
MLFRAYFRDRGEDEQRTNIVIPDTAHGTNPASVTMAGYKLTPVRTDARGNIDVEDLRTKVDEHTAGLMLTNPSTLGLFDENIQEIERPTGPGASCTSTAAEPGRGVRHRDRDMGSTSCTSTCTRRSRSRTAAGPGGPIAVQEMLEPFRRCGSPQRRHIRLTRPAESIGKVRAPRGRSVCSSALRFMRSYGPGLREMGEVAVLNANYMLARLKGIPPAGGGCACTSSCSAHGPSSGSTG